MLIRGLENCFSFLCLSTVISCGFCLRTNVLIVSHFGQKHLLNVLNVNVTDNYFHMSSCLAVNLSGQRWMSPIFSTGTWTLTIMQHVIPPNSSNIAAWTVVLSFKLWYSASPAVSILHIFHKYFDMLSLVFNVVNGCGLVSLRHNDHLVRFRKRSCFVLK